MSLHKSLKQRSALARRRNVLTRAERVERLKQQERWDEQGGSVFGLPKVKSQVVGAPPSRGKREKAEAAKSTEAGPETGTETDAAAAGQ